MFLMALSCFFWVSSYIYPNEHAVHFIETTLVRSLVGVFANYTAGKIVGNTFEFKTKTKTDRFYLHSKSIIVSFYMTFIPFCMFYLPLPIIYTITSGLLINVAVIDYLKNGIKINKFGKIGICFGIFGIILIANNRSLMSLIDN